MSISEIRKRLEKAKAATLKGGLSLSGHADRVNLASAAPSDIAELLGLLDEARWVFEAEDAAQDVEEIFNEWYWRKQALLTKLGGVDGAAD